LPTEEFWELAALTPLSPIYVAGLIAAVLLVQLALGIEHLLWWHYVLAVPLISRAWAGLLERWGRRYFSRLRRHALEHEHPLGVLGAEPPARHDDGIAVLEPPRGSSESMPQTWGILPTGPFWSAMWRHWFGRASGLMALVAEFVFASLIFYPSWQTRALGWLVVPLTLGLAERLMRRRDPPALKMGIDCAYPDRLDRPS